MDNYHVMEIGDNINGDISNSLGAERDRMIIYARVRAHYNLYHGIREFEPTLRRRKKMSHCLQKHVTNGDRLSFFEE